MTVPPAGRTQQRSTVAATLRSSLPEFQEDLQEIHHPVRSPEAGLLTLEK